MSEYPAVFDPVPKIPQTPSDPFSELYQVAAQQQQQPRPQQPAATPTKQYKYYPAPPVITT